MSERQHFAQVLQTEEQAAFRAYLIGRAALYFAILAGLGVMHATVGTTGDVGPLVWLVLAMLALSIPYYLLGERSKSRIRALGLGIILIEVWFLAIGQYLLGGENAVYGLVIYCLAVVMAATVHSARGAYAVAVVGSASYALMVIATQTGWIPVRAGVFRFSVAEAWPWTTVSFNALASVGTAVAASSLAGVARRALGRFRELEKEMRELNEDLERRIDVAVAALRSTNASLAARNEDLGRTLRHVGLFARAVSHDLRNPVTAGGEFLRLARSGDGASKERFLSLAAENLLRADRMLIGLRDLMRAMGSPRREEPIDVRGVVEDVIAELRVARGGEPPPVCLVGQFSETKGQVEQLVHIFRNLIGNAFEHNRRRSGLRVEVGQDGHGDGAAFYVRDNGAGIPHEVQARMFEPFRRGPSSEGDGLGLALVEAIVANAGGKVWVESVPGSGATIRFTYPNAVKE